MGDEEFQKKGPEKNQVALVAGLAAAFVLAFALYALTKRHRTPGPPPDIVERPMPNPIVAPAPEQRPPPSGDGGSATAELEHEASLGLKGIFVAEKAYFAEHDQYSANLDEVGFQPDDWCADGARQTIHETPTAFKKVGCHFVYEIETMGSSPQMTFSAYARGAAGRAVGLNYEVDSSGDNAGIPRRMEKQ